jgi:hypothetical protein
MAILISWDPNDTVTPKMKTEIESLAKIHKLTPSDQGLTLTPDQIHSPSVLSDDNQTPFDF